MVRAPKKWKDQLAVQTATIAHTFLVMIAIVVT